MTYQDVQAFRPAVIDKFLSAPMRTLIPEELAFCHWTPSTVLKVGADGRLGNQHSSGRVSLTTYEYYFPRPLLRALRRIEARIAKLLRVPPSHFESWQATRYRAGGAFTYHHDAGNFAHEPSGERLYTVQVYLKSPRGGGETDFRELGVEIAPTAGRFIAWRNVDDMGIRNPDMLHASRPVRQGEKITLVTWVRQRPIRSEVHNSKGADNGQRQ
jgi:prolyl 4-hydroxylase